MTLTASALTANSRNHVRPSTGALLTIGIDVGGTKIASVVTDKDDRVLLHEIEPTEAGRLAGQVSSMVRRAIEHFAPDTAAAAGETISAVGVAVPGYVEPGSGTFGLAVNLGGPDIALGPMVEEMFGLPCYLEHDARTAAAWLYESATKGPKGSPTGDLAYLSVGTGIAAGLVLDGRIFRGANGLAGEIGHLVAEPDGPSCPCGLRGCLETVAAGPAITRMAREAAASGRPTTLSLAATAADLFQAAAAGDEVAAELVTAVANSLARAIRGLALALGVTHIIVGGGVAAAGDALLGPLMTAIGRERAASPLIDAAFAHATVELLSPQIEAGARGAAAIARQRFQADQREGVGDR